MSSIYKLRDDICFQVTHRIRESVAGDFQTISQKLEQVRADLDRQAPDALYGDDHRYMSQLVGQVWQAGADLKAFATKVDQWVQLFLGTLQEKARQMSAIDAETQTDLILGVDLRNTFDYFITNPINKQSLSELENCQLVNQFQELYGPSGPSPNDFAQGQTGDCYFSAVLMGIAAQNPQAIRRIIQDNHDNSYTVTFYEILPFGFYQEHKITVSPKDFFTDGVNSLTNQTDHKKCLWPQVLEAAYAKYIGGYDKLNAGGNPADVGPALLGNSSVMFTNYHQGWKGSVFNLYNQSISLSDLVKRFNNQEVVNAADTNEDQGIISNHAYVVTGIRENHQNPGASLIYLKNPWGKDDLILTYDEFINKFNQFSACATNAPSRPRLSIVIA